MNDINKELIKELIRLKLDIDSKDENLHFFFDEDQNQIDEDIQSGFRELEDEFQDLSLKIKKLIDKIKSK